ncbi:MAG: septum formation initiator family protein [Gemmatimonadetes bacterium]|nr:septum formation initiator family protein [Gemmatimonadota bacterium]NIU76189.1 septum formation initiator family protein [Gammaproteobacteria bacterium]NIW37700.1 septum formation initiator family protein [Gemmatimonadota bacterium]NIX48372.1 septum formation initiator family protein [Gemmatimonadota bacterium]NIY12812.1 septum formation initiator family protein [Gemmatimonadota bacterium]
MTRRLVFPLLLGLAAYYALFGGEYSVFEVRHARAERTQAEAQLAELRQEIEALRARADSLESDPAAMERIAREKFGMIREGEILYRLVPEPAEAAPESTEAEADETG